MNIIERINACKDWKTLDTFKRKDFIEFLSARDFTCDPLTGKYCKNMDLMSLRHWVLVALKDDREKSAQK